MQMSVNTKQENKWIVQANTLENFTFSSITYFNKNSLYKIK